MAASCSAASATEVKKPVPLSLIRSPRSGSPSPCGATLPAGHFAVSGVGGRVRGRAAGPVGAGGHGPGRVAWGAAVGTGREGPGVS
ncbi:hypothetical protein GCM10010519_30720 [Streptomyces lactacystinicus]